MKKMWLLGLGLFSISVTWSLYNAFVPFFLEKYITSIKLIGFMMTIDNYFAIVIQPIIGRRSDRTNSFLGKRMPFLLIGMPLAALFTALIPWHNSLFMLIIFMICMNLSMSIYRSPVIALMPDITPNFKRTQASGIINFMGGVGAIIAFVGGSYLYDQHNSLPFLTTSLLTLLCLVILLWVIREKRDSISYQPTTTQPLTSFRAEWNRSTFFLIGAIFFWFFSYQGVETLFTLYGKNHLGLSEAQSGFSLAFFSVAFVAAAIPSGLLGKRFGKKRLILTGVIGLILTFGLITFIESMFALRMLLLIGGVFWALININSYPFVIALGKESSIGTRTGIYYFASSLAAITSPPIMGALIDGFGYSSLFYTATGGMIIALFFILGVKDRGLAQPRAAEQQLNA
ncbi:SLC45 family MFS transporter [Paenibacillus sp. GSMTC-2017]|uniref:SLC45 family MFS transporter n=1 Tax=Paenibacillus sp. GSMTC-2017 TaxID=2794350 RepID=UPI0018D89166|nr:SLC45 family MFS transporter [Paenibacillus sp. GSMTC-2017]MBH5320178.1 SLC45 family MFS transporter [Paenibacillus sp. GSMTC-2017]